MGTSSIGRDVFWELWASARNSLILGLIAALIASHMGLLLGLIAGVRGGWVEKIIMFLSDTIIAVPALILLVLIIMILRSLITLPLIGVLISLIAWAWPTRQVRSIALSLRERTFMTSSPP